MPQDSSIDLGRPVAGDVIDLILDDHRRFEDLLRQLRSSDSDREKVLEAFSTLHVAHAEAEEKLVYPQLKKRRAVDADEADHGEHEHAEGHEALLTVMECASTDTQKWADAVEQLSAVVSHHLVEEELTILNPAREDLGPRVLDSLGEEFAAERNRQIDADCGRIENLRRIVTQAKDEGLIDD
ncbi:hemerythrin domain-containing protein [Aeromicrobium sp. CTD01-1L150]|uniref:hemerythrin domain-containing protein n=1 Tax=Aeromicrobium sp. CTD01-1L150 TaxID=3341830 RepID=UPI0035C1B04E